MNSQNPDSNERARSGAERLLALLRELIRREGLPETAELLDVSARTLQRTVASGRLTVRMRDVLELQRLSEGGEAAPQRGANSGELERRVEQLQDRVDTLAETVRSALTVVRSDAKPQPGQAAQGTSDGARPLSPPAVKGAPQVVTGKPHVSKPWRPYPQLVTLEPEAGEEFIYGAATPLIVEWRQASVEHIDRGRSRLDRATAWVRMRELEIVLVGKHELTLAPAVYPWSRMERGREVWRREQSLADARAERRWALFWRWVRRLLTLGLWWK